VLGHGAGDGGVGELVGEDLVRIRCLRVECRFDDVNVSETERSIEFQIYANKNT